MPERDRVSTAESVAEGHPDKVCDQIVDAVLDAYLEQDPESRVACEAAVKNDRVVLFGEIGSSASVDHEAVVRRTVSSIGYDDPDQTFAASTVSVQEMLSAQSAEIGEAVSDARDEPGELGAGDQGIMVGYASDETPELMPLPILLAHRLTAALADDRREGRATWLRPDGKSQVSVRYRDDEPAEVAAVVVSTQHDPEVGLKQIREFVAGDLAPRALGDWYRPDIVFHVNSSGSFITGGPAADSGLSGRKVVVDAYGPTVPHGGGSFSGKDPTKVDRSGAYFGRWAARRIVQEGLAQRVRVEVAYVIGEAKPVALSVDTLGTGDERAARELLDTLDFRPAAIIDRLRLRRPVYQRTACCGHFGRQGFTWEE